MTIMIDLRPEAEAMLAERAALKGVPLRQYVSDLVQSGLPDMTPDRLSTSQRAAQWRPGTENLTWTPQVSDEAISRDE